MCSTGRERMQQGKKCNDLLNYEKWLGLLLSEDRGNRQKGPNRALETSSYTSIARNSIVLSALEG